LQEKFKQTLLLIILTYLIIMRKKFIAVYALMAVLALGSTTLTSCVDDNESASVTAIRDLKMQQLQALVTYNTASAKMQELRAKMAEATYDADLAAELAQAERNLQDAELAIKNSLNNYQQGIMTNYSNALNKVGDLTTEIAQAKLQKAQLEIDTTYAKEIVKNQIRTQEKTVKSNEAALEVYKNLADNGYDELVTEQKQVEIQKKENSEALAVNTNKLTTANTAYVTAQGDIARRYVDNNGNISLDIPSDNVLEPTNAVAQAAYTLTDMYAEYSTKITGFQPVINKAEKIELSEGSDIAIKIFTLNKNNEIDATKAMADYVESMKEALGTDKDKANQYGSAYAQKAYADEQLAAAEKALAAAEKALAAADEDDPNYAQLKADVVREEGNVRSMTKNVNTEADELADAIENYDDAVALQKEYTEALKTFTDATAYKAYTDRVTAIVNTEGKAKAELDAEKLELTIKSSELTAKEIALNGLVNGSIDIETEIATCESNIAEAQKEIAKLELVLSQVNGGQILTDDLLAILDTEIANAEAEKAVYEKLAEQYKQQLEASINGGTTAE
jgi:chromosome segregation ATPase